MQNKLYLDIETLPAGEEKHDLLRKVFRKNRAKQKRHDGDDDFEQYLLGTSFDGAFGRILCIGYALNDEPTEILYENGDEKKMLQKFWDIAKNIDLFIGHNVMDFDLRFIYQRSVVNKVRPLKELNFARYRSNPIYDTAREWNKWSGPMIGLENLALALGIPSPKDGIDGSQVYSFYQQDRVKEILDYCKRDVETTRRVYKKMIFDTANDPKETLFE
jgi:hypothetical protein